MKILLWLLLCPALAHAGPYYEVKNSTSVGVSTMSISGHICVAASTSTYQDCQLRLDGPGGFIQFPDGTTQSTAGGGGGASTVTVNTDQFSGNGSPASPLTLKSSSVTLEGNGTLVRKAGDTMTGDLALPNLTATYGVSAATGVFTSSVTASAFYGDGSNLTGLATDGELATEISRATSRENDLGASTGTIKASLDEVIVSTGTLISTETDPLSLPLTGGTLTGNLSLNNGANTRNIYGYIDSARRWDLTTGQTGLFGGGALSLIDASVVTRVLLSAYPTEHGHNRIGHALSLGKVTAPTHMLDVNGGGVFSSSVTALSFHGSGASLTDIVATEADPVFTVSEAFNITDSSTTDWNTAYGWGDHAGLYLVSPASFTYQTPLVAGMDYLAPDGDGSGLSGVIQSTATGYYPLWVATATYALNGGGGGVVDSTAVIDGLPIGTIIQYSTTTAPDGYLYCDGSYVSTTTYSQLFAVTGHRYSTFTVAGSPAVFQLPDFRGMFARGAHGNLNSRDPEVRVVGSTQTDTMQGHVHEQRAYTTSGGNGISNAFNGTGTYRTSTSNTAPTDVPKTDGTNGTPRTSTETRPENIAVAFMIKYGHVGTVAISSSSLLIGGDNTFTGENTFAGSVSAATGVFTTLYGDGSALTGVIQSTATGNYLLRVATATYLATAPGACGAGEFINALTADGTKTCAAPAGGGDVVRAATQTFTGANTFTGAVSVSSITNSGYAAFTNPTSTTTFAGPVDIGRNTRSQVGASGIARAACASGTSIISGGCNISVPSCGAIVFSYQSSETTSGTTAGTATTGTGYSWTCGYTTVCTITATAICARVK